MLEVLGIKNFQKLVPIEDDMKPRDPVTENMNLLRSKPVKAFLYQDHRAHIAVHMSAAQDPKLQKMLAMNPQAAQTISAAMSAHVADHLGMEYRKQMEQAMGQTLPAYEDDQDVKMMAPDMEVKVSQMAAQAGQQLLAQNQQQAQQQKNEQQAQDPLIMLQKQELQIKQGDLQRKVAKDATDAQLKGAQIQVEKDRIEAQQQGEGMKLMAKTVSERYQIDSQQQSEGYRTAAEGHKHQQQLDIQRQQMEHQAQQRTPKKGE
jgi:hypothetical protein